MRQAEVFRTSEADRFYRRNAGGFDVLHAACLEDPEADPLLAALHALKPRHLLEVGCGNGWRLDLAHRLWGASGVGLEPSGEAVTAGRARFQHVMFRQCTADQIPGMRVDCVAFGFCLYLCDPADLFHIAAAADAVLVPGGHIAVYDFYAPQGAQSPYKHCVGLTSFKADYSRLWSWHPNYSLVRHQVCAHPGASTDDPNETLAVTILKKRA